MNDSRARGLLLAAVVWCVILTVLAVAYKFLLHPRLKGKLQIETGGQSQYQHQIKVAADSFSGYCILRSEELKEQLSNIFIRHMKELSSVELDPEKLNSINERMRLLERFWATRSTPAGNTAEG